LYFLNQTKMKTKVKDNSRILVIGTSVGGLQALENLISQLQPDFPLPIVIVQHISADATGNVLLQKLANLGNLKCQHGKNNASVLPGHLYLAPSDHHIIINDKKKILITKGAHENRSRPAIDPLFRSAAVAYGNGTIAILLTGYLDDGTAGMKVVKECGGICIVQDPRDAQYPDMPQNALQTVAIDYCLPLSEMGGLLYQILSSVSPSKVKIPNAVLIEAKIAERVLSDLPSVNALGEQVPFNCPGCGGVLWKISESGEIRFRCHVGHAYTAATLMAEQTMKIEETMWTALRMFEERKNLLMTYAQDKRGAIYRSAVERAAMSQVHIDRIRQILMADDKGTSSDMPS
jgi:two-component system chemotaxis response regulator CheB